MSLKSLLAGVVGFTSAGIAATLASMPAAAAKPPAPDVPANPLLAPWTGPYGGVPPFDRVQVDHLKPAFEAARAEKLGETDRGCSGGQPPAGPQRQR